MPDAPWLKPVPLPWGAGYHEAMERKLTSPTVLRELLARHGVRLRKELGQHFLADGNILAKIVELAQPQREETAVEVGAGAGTLTCALAPHVRELVAVEIDRRMLPLLAKTTSSFPNVRLVHADFRDLPLRSLGERLLVVGNLPYGITSDVLLKLIREREAVGRAVLMVQAEVGEKLVAPPGRGTSRLGVHLRAYYDVEFARRVPRNVFFPPPEVDSALIRLRRLPQPRITAPERAFEETLALLFSGRRKTLRRALLGRLAAGEVDRILAEVGLEPRVRGETLPLDQLDAIARTLQDTAPPAEEHR